MPSPPRRRSSRPTRPSERPVPPTERPAGSRPARPRRRRRLPTPRSKFLHLSELRALPDHPSVVVWRDRSYLLPLWFLFSSLVLHIIFCHPTTHQHMTQKCQHRQIFLCLNTLAHRSCVAWESGLADRKQRVLEGRLVASEGSADPHLPLRQSSSRCPLDLDRFGCSPTNRFVGMSRSTCTPCIPFSHKK